MKTVMIDGDKLCDWLTDEIDSLYAHNLLREAHEASYIFKHVKEEVILKDWEDEEE